MSDAGRGLPLLSGPPPPTDSEASHADIACRKCNKEFNMIFARARKCNHCGYSYCHSCSDYQALMPRTGNEMGYDAMHVCAFCIEFLTITAAGRQQLKAMSLAKLKKYTDAYNIKVDRIVEKDDLIDAILAARSPDGCLPRVNENFYRNYSVPNKAPQGRPRGLFSRNQGPSSNQPPPAPPRQGPTHEFARPDLAPDNPPHSHSYPQYPPRPQPAPQPQQQQYNPPPGPPPRTHSAHPNTPPHNLYSQYHTPPPRQPQGGPPYNNGYPGQGPQNYQAPPRNQAPPPRNQAPPPRNQAPPPPPYASRPPPQPAPQQPHPYHNYSNQPPPPRPTTQRPPPQAQPSQPQQAPPRPRTVSTQPPPTLDQLLNMTQEAIRSLSIGVLKSILFTNHINTGQILEKSDLVQKVLTLVEVEKADRERQRQAEEREEMERMQREMDRQEERQRAAERERAASDQEQTTDTRSPSHAHSEASTEGTAGSNPQPSSTPPKPAPAPPKMFGSASTLERTGLCVICQDEEANIAIVDCGHMAMCRGCSDLVMSSSRECPLCRTRIVTEARLLRIFKT